MALSEEELQQLAEYMAARQPQPESQPENTVAQTGRPDVDPEAGPTYYVHLANGDVIESKDSGATHMGVDGETVAVIGRYQKHPVQEG